MFQSLYKRARGITIASGVAGVMALSASSAWAQSLREQMVGTWTLVAQYVEKDGKRIERFGADPKGMVIYDRNGHFVSILHRSQLPKYASNNALNGTPEEYKAIAEGSTAFYGTWEVDEGSRTATSHVVGSTFPNWTGQVQKRDVKIEGDTLSVSTSSQIGGTVTAIWKRVK